MITKINNKKLARMMIAGVISLLCPLSSLLLSSCSDKWDDHYDGTAQGVQEGSLWEAIQQNPELSNFCSVVQACGYDKSLASAQVFTVFAPTNSCLSKEEADKLIAAYNAEKDKVDDNDNSTIKEFLQNHIALYNYSVSSSSNDSIVMMNGKNMVLTSSTIGDSPLTSTNKLYGNGVLFTVGSQVDYFPNVFEYIRRDADLDSLYSFFYNEHFYRKEFLPEKSVEGGIVDGRTVYLDSVFRQHNDLFESEFLNARLDNEDSTYWMLMPTNEVWSKLIDEYQDYFNYDNTVNKRDSIFYTNARMAIVKGMAFSRTTNTDAMLQDSAMSTNAVLNYTSRKYMWGADSLHYYQYFSPLGAGGIFAGNTNVECSNGIAMKVADWKINKLETFFQTKIIEAESQGNIREVSRVVNKIISNPDGTKDTTWIETVVPRNRYVESGNAFYNKVSNNGFVEFEPTRTTVNHSVTFNIKDVLSNIGYDIYVVTAPALANDSNATDVQRLPTRLKFTLYHHTQDGKPVKTGNNEGVPVLNNTSVVNHPDEVDYIKVADNFKFPVASYGLEEDEPQVSLKVETYVTSTQQKNNTYTRTMRIDCIVLKPHEE
jgi:uncharacterized surface protein with fasciclin (FAS1) repeats